MDVTEELLKTIDSNDTHYNVALEILDLRFSSTLKQWEVQVRWKGFDDEEPTWEPILNIAEDITGREECRLFTSLWNPSGGSKPTLSDMEVRYIRRA